MRDANGLAYIVVPERSLPWWFRSLMIENAQANSDTRNTWNIFVFFIE